MQNYLGLRNDRTSRKRTSFSCFQLWGLCHVTCCTSLLHLKNGNYHLAIWFSCEDPGKWHVTRFWHLEKWGECCLLPSCVAERFSFPSKLGDIACSPESSWHNVGASVRKQCKRETNIQQHTSLIRDAISKKVDQARDKWVRCLLCELADLS